MTKRFQFKYIMYSCAILISIGTFCFNKVKAEQRNPESRAEVVPFSIPHGQTQDAYGVQNSSSQNSGSQNSRVRFECECAIPDLDVNQCVKTNPQTGVLESFQDCKAYVSFRLPDDIRLEVAQVLFGSPIGYLSANAGILESSNSKRFVRFSIKDPVKQSYVRHLIEQKNRSALLANRAAILIRVSNILMSTKVAKEKGIGINVSSGADLTSSFARAIGQATSLTFNIGNLSNDLLGINLRYLKEKRVTFLQEDIEARVDQLGYLDQAATVKVYRDGQIETQSEDGRNEVSGFVQVHSDDPSQVIIQGFSTSYALFSAAFPQSIHGEREANRSRGSGSSNTNGESVDRAPAPTLMTNYNQQTPSDIRLRLGQSYFHSKYKFSARREDFSGEMFGAAKSSEKEDFELITIVSAFPTEDTAPEVVPSRFDEDTGLYGLAPGLFNNLSDSSERNVEHLTEISEKESLVIGFMKSQIGSFGQTLAIQLVPKTFLNPNKSSIEWTKLSKGLLSQRVLLNVYDVTRREKPFWSRWSADQSDEPLFSVPVQLENILAGPLLLTEFTQEFLADNGNELMDLKVELEFDPNYSDTPEQMSSSGVINTRSVRVHFNRASAVGL